jgi:hypothetical protein
MSAPQVIKIVIRVDRRIPLNIRRITHAVNRTSNLEALDILKGMTYEAPAKQCNSIDDAPMFFGVFCIEFKKSKPDTLRRYGNREKTAYL